MNAFAELYEKYGGRGQLRITESELADIDALATAAGVRMPGKPVQLFGREIVIVDAPLDRAAIADLAVAYCAAMHANKSAEPRDLERVRCEVDRTYYEMMVACGYFKVEQ